MALVLKDRVKETTTTTSTGAYTLDGAVAGYQSFSVIGDGNTTYYAVANETDWEVGIGTYTASGTTLSRDTILESSNSGNAVNWGAGSKDVFVTYPAERSMYVEGSVITPAIAAQLPLANGGTGANLTDPNADRILFWDDSAGAVTWLEAGSGLTISGTTISTSGGGVGTAVVMALVFG